MKGPEAFATVPAMVPPAAKLRVREARRQRLERERRRRRLALLVLLGIVAVVTALVAAFGGSGKDAAALPVPASASRLLPSGPPQPEIVANIGSLHLQLPVGQSRVTAIGYQGGSTGALALSPVGTQANQGLLRRLVRAVFGSSNGRPRWYQLPGGVAASTSAVDVGAAPGTDVYSPVDGTIVAIRGVVVGGQQLGSRIDIEPTGAPSLVVSVSHIAADAGLAVGSVVTSGTSQLGQLLDFSRIEREALARYTNDEGNHVAIEVHPAATLQVP